MCSALAVLKDIQSVEPKELSRMAIIADAQIKNFIFLCSLPQYGDTMTNIVVVQFSDNVQTGRDKRFNLTCIFRGPGEAVVTSGYIGAG